MVDDEQQRAPKKARRLAEAAATGLVEDEDEVRVSLLSFVCVTSHLCLCACAPSGHPYTMHTSSISSIVVFPQSVAPPLSASLLQCFSHIAVGLHTHTRSLEQSRH